MLSPRKSPALAADAEAAAPPAGAVDAFAELTAFGALGACGKKDTRDAHSVRGPSGAHRGARPL